MTYHWKTILAETQITFENKEYVLAVGYVNFQPFDDSNLYIRIWDKDHCICGDYVNPCLDFIISENKPRWGVSAEFIKYCVDKARRIEKLKAFA